MIDPKKLEQVARQIHESIPKNIREFSDEIEKKIRQILQVQLMRFNLVNREEFDIQMKMLQRTREKLELLEKRLTDLENHRS